jgi:transcriptional regulator with XRE-family HTH domain
LVNAADRKKSLDLNLQSVQIALMEHMHPIRAYRKANNLRLEDFAEAIGISCASLSRIEQRKQNPPLNVLIRIRDASSGAISIDQFPAPIADAALPAVWSANGAD